MADTLSSGGSASNRVRVQISSPAPNMYYNGSISAVFFIYKVFKM